MTNPKSNSFSRIDQFCRCERYSFFNAVEPVDPTPVRKAAMDFGSGVHDMLETFAIKRKDKLSVEDASYVARQRAQVLAKDVEDEKERELYQFRLIDHFERALEVVKGLEFRQAEGWFRDVDGLPVLGKIDVIAENTPIFRGEVFSGDYEDKPCVLDYKISKSPYSAQKNLNDVGSSLQLQIYCLAEGISQAAFLYILPNGPARGAVGVYRESQLKLVKRWLREKIRVVDLRWQVAKERGGDNGYDPAVFSIARHDDYLCNPKYCEFWSRCLGKEDNS